VLAAFGMKDMVNLRIVAICSNLAFITYAVMLNLPPILTLHVILLPLNGWRLAQELQSRRMVQRKDLCPPPGHVERLNQYTAKLLMRDDARRIAVNIAELPEFLKSTRVAGFLCTVVGKRQRARNHSVPAPLHGQLVRLAHANQARAKSPNVNGKENLPLVIPPLNIGNKAPRFIDEI